MDPQVGMRLGHSAIGSINSKKKGDFWTVLFIQSEDFEALPISSGNYQNG